MHCFYKKPVYKNPRCKVQNLLRNFEYTRLYCDFLRNSRQIFFLYDTVSTSHPAPINLTRWSIGFTSLVSIKNRGGLVFPSYDVFKILSICELIFKGYCAGDDFENPKISSHKNLKSKIKYQVISELRFQNIFTVLNNNHFENEIGSEDLHSSQLTEMIVNKYLDIRMYRYAQFYEKNVIKKGKIGVRQQSTKLLLFKGL